MTWHIEMCIKQLYKKNSNSIKKAKNNNCEINVYWIRNHFKPQLVLTQFQIIRFHPQPWRLFQLWWSYCLTNKALKYFLFFVLWIYIMYLHQFPNVQASILKWRVWPTCPRNPALVVVKLTSVITEAASGGMKGAGFLVAMKRRKSSL